MPDWENLVRSQLGGLELEAQREEEIIAELAGHLQEAFENLRRCGVPDSEAIQRTLEEVPDGKSLCRQIRHASHEEEIMNQRVKSLWIPGLAMLTLSVLTSLLDGFLLTDMLSRDFQISHSLSISIDGPWLLTLPLIGALGAFWSRRMGGSLARQLAVCQFPVTATFVIFFVLLPVAFLLDSGMRVLSLSFLESYAMSWVVLPSIALLVGALPATLIGRQLQTRIAA